MSLLKLINIKVFLISLFVGLIYIYLTEDTKKINVYPSPSNIDKIEYRDKADSCFKYMMEEIKCPTKKADIHTIPIQ